MGLSSNEGSVMEGQADWSLHEREIGRIQQIRGLPSVLRDHSW